MRGRIVAVAAMLALVLLLAGCAGAGKPGNDGLHKTAPKVVGLSQTDATARIVDAGYDVGSVASEQSQDSDSGTVIRQDPVAGTTLPRGSEIDLIVAE